MQYTTRIKAEVELQDSWQYALKNDEETRKKKSEKEKKSPSTSFVSVSRVCNKNAWLIYAGGLLDGYSNGSVIFLFLLIPLRNEVN